MRNAGFTAEQWLGTLDTAELRQAVPKPYRSAPLDVLGDLGADLHVVEQCLSLFIASSDLTDTKRNETRQAYKHTKPGSQVLKWLLDSKA